MQLSQEEKDHILKRRAESVAASLHQITNERPKICKDKLIVDGQLDILRMVINGHTFEDVRKTLRPDCSISTLSLACSKTARDLIQKKKIHLAVNLPVPTGRWTSAHSLRLNKAFWITCLDNYQKIE
jgi:hypothetical protein